MWLTEIESYPSPKMPSNRPKAKAKPGSVCSTVRYGIQEDTENIEAYPKLPQQKSDA